MTDTRTPPEHSGEHDEATWATVHPLPVTSDDTDRPATDAGTGAAVEPVGEVIDAELVDEEEYRRLRSQREQALERWRGYRSDVVTAGRAVHRVATHDHTRAAGKTVIRHGAYWAGGSLELGRRGWSRVMHSDLTAAIRAARAQGDWQAVKELQQEKRAAADSRVRRLLDGARAALTLLKVTVAVILIFGVLYLLGSILAAVGLLPGFTFTGMWGGLFRGIAAGLEWAIWAGTWAPRVVAVCLVLVGVFLPWKVGRNTGMVPAWAQKPGDHTGAKITPSVLVTALRDVGISPLRKAIQDDPDAGAWMLGPITKVGPGVEVHVTLPRQVNADDVMKHRATLAGNIDRKAHEVLLSKTEDSEREFTLWVADSGALDQPVPDSPLMDPEYGPVDLYRDLMPWGIGLKGDQIELTLLQLHLLLVGMSKQGKTAAARALILWAGMDPSVRIWLSDLKGFGDWSMFEGIAETLIEGAGDENFIATCDMLEAAVAEMERRYAAWREAGRKGDIDRESSLPGSGFEPLFVVVDEVQKLYMCTTVHPDDWGGDIGGNGKRSRAARAAQALHDQARAVNIHLFQFAQNPTDRNLPVVIREGAMVRASLYVGTESIARMGLGEAPVDTGAAPHALRAGLDRGTVVLAPGEAMDLPNGATHTTVRTHFIGTEDAYTIADRIKAFRAGTARRADAGVQRDLLDDLIACFNGEDEVRDTDMVTRLRQLAGRAYQPYKKLTGTKLRDLLAADEYGIKCTQKRGYWQIRSQDVHAARSQNKGG